MTISPNSGITQIHPPQAPTPASVASAQSHSQDSIQLSAAAKALLKSGDADHDGDSH
jgi:hypothetical protein